MPNGTIKFFGVAKKYGFVSPEDESKAVFVPIASLAAAGISALVAGQRVSFETLPDGKGPKAVDLKLIDAPAPTSATSWTLPRPKMEGRAEQLALYYDPTSEGACNVLALLRASGFEPRMVHYVATPPSADELKEFSMLLRDGSLVRRYDPPPRRDGPFPPCQRRLSSLPRPCDRSTDRHRAQNKVFIS